MKSTTSRKRQEAAEAYAERLQMAQNLQGRIKSALDAHRKEAQQDRFNWGFPGDLGRVNEQLAYVLASLGDTSAVEEMRLEY